MLRMMSHDVAHDAVHDAARDAAHDALQPSLAKAFMSSLEKLACPGVCKAGSFSFGSALFILLHAGKAARHCCQAR